MLQSGGLGDFQTLSWRLAARRAVGSVGVYGAFFNLVAPLVLPHGGAHQLVGRRAGSAFHVEEKWNRLCY